MVYWSESPPIVSQIKLVGIASGLGMLEGVCSCLEGKITKIHQQFQHNYSRQTTGSSKEFDPNFKKSSNMKSTQLELFKTSKIIKIGSRSSENEDCVQYFIFAKNKYGWGRRWARSLTQTCMVWGQIPKWSRKPEHARWEQRAVTLLLVASRKRFGAAAKS